MTTNFIDIVFDGPPGVIAPRFVEVESPPGVSIRMGEWLLRDDGFWVLRLPPPAFLTRDTGYADGYSWNPETERYELNR